MIFVMNYTGNAIIEVKSDIFTIEHNKYCAIQSDGMVLAYFDLKECLVDKRDGHYYKMAKDEVYPNEKYIEDEITEHEFKQAIKEVDEYNLYQRSLMEAVFVELVDTIQEKLINNEGRNNLHRPHY